MTFFTSKRERNLWLCTFCVVSAIYATLGLSSILADIFYNELFGIILFLTCMILIGVIVLTQGLQLKPHGFDIGIAIGIFVVYLFMFFRMAIPERSHLIEYSVLAVFIFEALSERRQNGRGLKFTASAAIVMTSLIGIFDESIQIFLPNRVFDPQDMLFNILAATMAVLSVSGLRWVILWRNRNRQQR